MSGPAVLQLFDRIRLVVAQRVDDFWQDPPECTAFAYGALALLKVSDLALCFRAEMVDGRVHNSVYGDLHHENDVVRRERVGMSQEDALSHRCEAIALVGGRKRKKIKKERGEAC